MKPTRRNLLQMAALAPVGLVSGFSKLLPSPAINTFPKERVSIAQALRYRETPVEPWQPAYSVERHRIYGGTEQQRLRIVNYVLNYFNSLGDEKYVLDRNVGTLNHERGDVSALMSTKGKVQMLFYHGPIIDLETQLHTGYLLGYYATMTHIENGKTGELFFVGNRRKKDPTYRTVVIASDKTTSFIHPYVPYSQYTCPLPLELES